MNEDKAIYHLFRDAVIVHVNGHTFSISKDDPRYQKIFGLIMENKCEEMGAIADNRAVKELRGLLDFLD
jgi:hypothetical protein